MAELVLKVGNVGDGTDPTKYRDGDILCAFNRRRIRCVHAEHICHPWAAGFNASGLRPIGSLAQEFYERTHRYRFTRVSETEVQRLDLVTLGVVLFDGTPRDIDGRLQQMDVRLFVARRKRHPGHVLFGTPGAEVWYGGTKDFSHSRLDLVWNSIETRTPLREVDHTLFPHGPLVKRHFLLVPTEDFTDERAQRLVEPDVDVVDDGRTTRTVIVQKRLRRVDWRAHVGGASRITAIEDRSVEVDLRTVLSAFDDTDIALTRTRG